MSSESPSEERSAGFWGQWGTLIVVLSLLTAAVFALRFLMENRADAPVIEQHARVVDAFATQSPLARRRLEAYFTKYQRRTVASRHYARLCSELHGFAAEDRIDFARVPGGVRACPRIHDADQHP